MSKKGKVFVPAHKKFVITIAFGLATWCLTNASLAIDEVDIDRLSRAANMIKGDIEYGEYLSGECVTCHQLSSDADGIPAIIGWATDSFIYVMFEYKHDQRENPVMTTIAKRLRDEEMAALAAYFETIEAK